MQDSEQYRNDPNRRERSSLHGSLPRCSLQFKFSASAQIAGNRGYYRPQTVTIHARRVLTARATARPQAKKNPARGGAKSGRKRPNRTKNLCFARLGGRIVTGALCPRSLSNLSPDRAFCLAYKRGGEVWGRPVSVSLHVRLRPTHLRPRSHAIPVWPGPPLHATAKPSRERALL
jgi:hypothetical protein